jgi:hypothetical protein
MTMIKLSNMRPFSELNHNDWFIDVTGYIGVKISHENKDYAHFFSGNYGCLQDMSHDPQVQILENVNVKYEFTQRVIRDVIVTREVDEYTKGELYFNEIPF